MKLSEYQAAAAATADPKAFSLDYLIPGIVGEVGELHGQKAKSHWHGWDADKLQKELVSEYGDICWMTAILLSTHGVTAVPQVTWKQHKVVTEKEAWHILLQKATFLSLWTQEERTMSYLQGEAQQLWLALEDHCETITGMCFDHVLGKNLTKLADRARRGTLVGSGDHR